MRCPFGGASTKLESFIPQDIPSLAASLSTQIKRRILTSDETHKTASRRRSLGAKQEERASSRRRTSGSHTVDVVQPQSKTNQDNLSVISPDSESEVERDEANDGHSLQSRVENSSNPNEPNPWGFVVYRTVYDNDDRWAPFKTRLEDIIDGESESIRSEGADPLGFTLKYVEDKATLENLTSQQIRLGKLFNPNYKPRSKDSGEEEESDIDDSPPSRDDEVCEEACLMVDEASMESIINHSEDHPGYVIAVDAVSEESEKWTVKEGTEDELIQCEYDGSMKVHVEFLPTEFYLRSLKDGVLTIGEIHGEPDQIWSGGD